MFSLNQTSRVALDIFNIRGQKVRTLISEEMEAGYHSIEWNGTDDNSNPVGSGVYFSKFHSEGREEPGDFTSVKKMIIMK
jgi:flagellar hook assembly protein FlgD